MYENGRGVPPDFAVAANWYRNAADQGSAYAQCALGFMYDTGQGVPQDDAAALSWYRKAVGQGNANAQNALGVMHLKGRGGLPKDEREAARLFKLAADRGNASAQKNLDNLYSRGRGVGADVLPWLANNFLSEGERAVLDGLKRWVSCPHGVLAGKYKNRCEKCVRERTEIEENRKRQHELWERQQRIDAAAKSLRENERLRLVKSLVPSIEELRQISWQHFEDEVARMFERLGFAVEQTPYVKDHGRDGILKKDGKKFLYECKKYGDGNLSGRRDLQVLYAEIERGDAVSGFFVTTGGFTRDAVEYAPDARIKLVGPDDLVRMMFDSKPAAADDDTYRSMCRQCEDVVSHRLRAPQSTRCRQGHDVEPTLDVNSVLSVSAKAGTRRTRRRARWRS